MSRGICSDALAAEVYRLTHAAMHRRFRTASAHKTAVPEAVGAAYVRWLGSNIDKTPISAKLHAFWLTKTATVFILGGAANLERRGRSVRCIATAIRETWSGGDDGTGVQENDARDAIYRVHYEVVALDSHEDNTIDALDAAQVVYRGRKCATWREDLADALGVSYGLILRYLDPDDSITPRAWRQDDIIALAAADGFAPTAAAVTVAPTYRKRRSVES